MKSAPTPPSLPAAPHSQPKTRTPKPTPGLRARPTASAESNLPIHLAGSWAGQMKKSRSANPKPQNQTQPKATHAEFSAGLRTPCPASAGSNLPIRLAESCGARANEEKPQPHPSQKPRPAPPRSGGKRFSDRPCQKLRGLGEWGKAAPPPQKPAPPSCFPAPKQASYPQKIPDLIALYTALTGAAVGLLIE